jgi:hypothetical protein
MFDFTKTPAVLGTEKFSKRSDKYNFLSTKNVVDVFEENNWNVHSVSQVRNQRRTQHKKDFARHLISFTNPDLKEVNGIIPRIVVINSHDGSSKFKMMAGFFRFLCANGLIVADSTFETIAVKHSKLAPEIIEEGIKRYIDVVPQITAKTEEMNSIILSPVDQLQLSGNISKRIWDGKTAPIQPSQLLEYRRPEDKERTLWKTYNTIQENIVNGGLTGKTKTGKKLTTRGITSIKKTININQILWEETNNFLLAA